MATLPHIEHEELTGAKPLPGRPLTEAEFVDWCDEDTWAEWVDGRVVLMSPVNVEHGSLAMFLGQLVGLFVQARQLGVVLGEPVQVRLMPHRRRRSPDLFFVAESRRDIIRKNHIEGPPDLIFEIVSPESRARDWREKYDDYETAGVREYWIVDPDARQVEAYALQPAAGYQPIPKADGIVRSTVLPGFYLKTAWLWTQLLPPVLDILAEFGVRAAASPTAES